MPKLALAEFLAIITTVAEEGGMGSVVEGIRKYGAQYSFEKDDGIACSLDVVDLTLGAEEWLEQKHGFAKCDFLDEIVVEGGDLGETYIKLCKTAGIEPDSSESVAA
jgi:hypothetical protein